MNTSTHSHNGGHSKVKSQTKSGVLDVLASLKSQLSPGRTKEFRSQVTDELRHLGWTHRIQIVAGSKISITAVNDGVGLCFQTGNMGRFYADLLKSQLLFSRGRISSGIFIVPTRQAARSLGANVTNFERMVRELEFYTDIITIPLVVVGIENEEI